MMILNVELVLASLQRSVWGACITPVKHLTTVLYAALCKKKVNCSKEMPVPSSCRTFLVLHVSLDLAG